MFVSYLLETERGGLNITSFIPFFEPNNLLSFGIFSVQSYHHRYRSSVSPSSDHTHFTGLTCKGQGHKPGAGRGAVPLSPQPPCQVTRPQAQSSHSVTLAKRALVHSVAASGQAFQQATYQSQESDEGSEQIPVEGSESALEKRSEKEGSPRFTGVEGAGGLDRSASSLNQTLQDPAVSDEEGKLEQDICEQSDAGEMDLEDFHLSWSISDPESDGMVREKQRSLGTEDTVSPFSGDAIQESTDSAETTLKAQDCLATSEEVDECTLSVSPDHNTPFPGVMGVVITPARAPPTAQKLADTSYAVYNLPGARHQKPFYRKPEDVQAPK